MQACYCQGPATCEKCGEFAVYPCDGPKAVALNSCRADYKCDACGDTTYATWTFTTRTFEVEEP